uniref:Uncharacterized protein n=1 Tax=Oryza sativa subsp. japonica TaxID=39947 RepID=Q6K8J7_ORYSJ|nr:hypothetical protein [Oryza sativa Japonica Group]
MVALTVRLAMTNVMVTRAQRRGRYRGAREVLQAAQCSPRENERFSIMAIVAHRHRPGLL